MTKWDCSRKLLDKNLLTRKYRIKYRLDITLMQEDLAHPGWEEIIDIMVLIFMDMGFMAVIIHMLEVTTHTLEHTTHTLEDITHMLMEDMVVTSVLTVLMPITELTQDITHTHTVIPTMEFTLLKENLLTQ